MEGALQEQKGENQTTRNEGCTSSKLEAEALRPAPRSGTIRGTITDVTGTSL
jgi:hypothetical protein